MAEHEHGDCTDAVHELYLFLDGELTEEKRVRIQLHLEECLPCYEAFDFEAELRQIVSTRCQEQVPDSLRARIVQALHQQGIGPPEPPTIGGVPGL